MFWTVTWRGWCEQWMEARDATKHPVGHGVSVGHLVMYDSAITWVIACQAPLYIEFYRQEYWSVLPCPTPGHLPNSGIEPKSPRSPELRGGFFTTSAI